MRLLFALAAVAVALLTACGSQCDESSSADASSNDATPNDAKVFDSSRSDAGTADGGSGISYIVIRLNNDECLPFPLPTGSGGSANCRVMLVVAGAGGCTSAGLSAAPMEDVSAINAKLQSEGQPPLQGALCVLSQLAADGGCTGNPSAGWCYVAGSCNPANTCKQDICTTAGVNVDGGRGAWLTCP